MDNIKQMLNKSFEKRQYRPEPIRDDVKPVTDEYQSNTSSTRTSTKSSTKTSNPPTVINGTNGDNNENNEMSERKEKMEEIYEECCKNNNNKDEDRKIISFFKKRDINDQIDQILEKECNEVIESECTLLKYQINQISQTNPTDDNNNPDNGNYFNQNESKDSKSNDSEGGNGTLNYVLLGVGVLVISVISIMLLIGIRKKRKVLKENQKILSKVTEESKRLEELKMNKNNNNTNYSKDITNLNTQAMNNSNQYNFNNNNNNNNNNLKNSQNNVNSYNNSSTHMPMQNSAYPSPTPLQYQSANNTNNINNNNNSNVLNATPQMIQSQQRIYEQITLDRLNKNLPVQSQSIKSNNNINQDSGNGSGSGSSNSLNNNNNNNNVNFENYKNYNNVVYRDGNVRNSSNGMNINKSYSIDGNNSVNKSNSLVASNNKRFSNNNYSSPVYNNATSPLQGSNSGTPMMGSSNQLQNSIQPPRYDDNISKNLTPPPIPPLPDYNEILTKQLQENSNKNIFKSYYYYQPSVQDELQISKGDVISFENVTYGDGWAFGTNETRQIKGVFPLGLLIENSSNGEKYKPKKRTISKEVKFLASTSKDEPKYNKDSLELNYLKGKVTFEEFKYLNSIDIKKKKEEEEREKVEIIEKIENKRKNFEAGGSSK